MALEEKYTQLVHNLYGCGLNLLMHGYLCANVSFISTQAFYYNAGTTGIALLPSAVRGPPLCRYLMGWVGSEELEGPLHCSLPVHVRRDANK